MKKGEREMKITLPDDFKNVGINCRRSSKRCDGVLEYDHVGYENSAIVVVFKCSACGLLHNRHHSVMERGSWSTGGTI